jgi:hypothetical protein
MTGTSDLPIPLDSDGEIDLAAFERAGLQWVRRWVKARLSGSDPYFRRDVRVDEDPETLLVQLLREAGPAHPASELIGQALLSLLDEARTATGALSESFEGALRLCAQVRVPETGSWFTEEVQRLGGDPGGYEQHWGGLETMKSILRAAQLQAPGLPGAVVLPAWRRLLEVPRYSTLALLGLGSTLRQQVPFLAQWFRACPSEQVGRELEHMVFITSQREGQESLRELLAAGWGGFPPPLREAFNTALANEKLELLQLPGSIPSPAREVDTSAPDSALPASYFRLSGELMKLSEDIPTWKVQHWIVSFDLEKFERVEKAIREIRELADRAEGEIGSIAAGKKRSAG